MEQKGIKVLLSDDEPDFLRLMSNWLESKGYLVMTCSDGESTVRLIKEESPDILLLDIRMPGMSGIQTLKKIREFNKTLPAIIVSAYIIDIKPGDVKSYGISGVFYKNRDFNDVSVLLESALRMHKKLK